MKTFYITLFFVFLSSFLFSQNWTKNLPQKKTKANLTFYDYKNAFESYWAPYNVDKGNYQENGVKKKAVGWKQFKRWEYYMESQIDPTTGAFPNKDPQEVYKNYLLTQPDLKSKSMASWTSLGTNSSTGGYAGVGRLNCIAYHPTDNNTYWVGAAAGGCWVTTNNGSSWTCLTDNNAALAVSDIIIPTDYATSNTIYIATGDKDHWDNRSVGVLKSTNGGATWNTTAINYTISQGKMVNRLLLDPNNNQTILAATSLGVYKTTNGGTTWSTQLTSTEFIDMEYKPGDFNTLYGSTTGGRIYMSSNGGSSWTQAFYDASANRIELAVSANQPTWVFALAAASNSGLYGIYKSTDNGATFGQVFAGTTKNLLGWYDGVPGSDDGGQGWYDLSLASSPSAANTILVGGVDTWRSTDGGLNWTIVGHWYGGYGAQAVHADVHTIRYRSNGDLFECNDGGIYVSSNNGTSWTDKTNGMVISQMYKLSVSKIVANEVITGLQDNGTKLLAGGAWSDVKGGDGMECLIDYSNNNIQYGTYVNGQISKTTNHWSSSTAIEPSGAGSGAWVTPYIIDPVNPLILYAGYADVWKTTDRGATWTQISTIASSNKIRSMAIAPSNTQVLFVADPYVLWKTSNGGTSWTNVTGTLPTGSGNITSIAIKNDEPNTIWVTMGGYNAFRVYQSIDGGTTWTNISTGLPQIPAYSVVQNKQSTTEVQLYVGTEVGVYYKKGSDNWIAFNSGLPNVSIGELEIYYATNPQNSKLRAATFGRGLWETPVSYSEIPMTYVSSTTTQSNTATVAPNQINQEIIGIEIVANGSLTSLSATSFTFNTNGSTYAATDIANAKLFSTGSSNTFATTTQFGSTISSPSGTFTIAGTQTLSDGTNYFWLAYDVPSGATLNNVLDAQCTSLTVGTAKTPSVTNPAGGRLIAISYCTAGATSTSYEYISNFAMGSINQASDRGTGGYEDYTTQNTTMQIGVNTTATITVTNPYSTDQVLIWIDWNRNGIFTDAGENVYTSSGSSFTTPHITTNFAAPSGAAIGTTRMRVRMNDSGAGPNATSCGTSTYGEVEDYSINVIPNCTVPPAPVIGNITQPSCTISTGSVVLNGLPATGTWILTMAPGGITSSGTGISSTISGLSTGTYSYTVTNEAGCTSTTSANIVINSQPSTPTAPVLGTITQPTCTEATGSLMLSGLPATGNWTLTSIPGSLTSTGTGTTSTFSGLLAASTYSFTVTNAEGCTSTESGSAVINSQPATPSTPAIGIITQPTCSVAAGSVVLYGLPATGNWTLTRSPGAITTLGSGTTSTISGLTTGTYVYTVTGTNGCISPASTNVVINVQPRVPIPAGIISGATSVCQGKDSVDYSVPVIGLATSYIWTFPTGATGTSTTNSIKVSYGISAVSGNVTVKGNNSCGDGIASTLAITVNRLPTNAGTITGNANVCQGQNSVSYSVSTIAYATSYVWNLPSGATGTSTTKNIAIDFGASAVSGNISVYGHNSCGDGVSRSKAITVNTVPLDAGTISGLSNVCQGQNSSVYFIPEITNATAYIWSLPAGASGNSNNDTITVNFGTNAVAGNITVKATNSCGEGNSSSLGITVNHGYIFMKYDTICYGELLNWQGTDYSASGIYTSNHHSIFGCDSNYTLYLTVKPAYSFTESKTVCEGDTYLWHGQSLLTDGIYQDIYKSAGGCDSIYTINLKVNPAFNIIQDHSICGGDTYNWHGQSLIAEGTYTANYQTVKGCDSTFTLHLSINPEGRSLQVKVFLEGLYTANGLMNQSMSISGPQFSQNIADNVSIELRDAMPPFNIGYNVNNINLYTNGMLTISNIPCNIDGLYYLVIKHRNSIETWSKQPVYFGTSSPITYDFTTAATQAFGNNLRQIGNIFAVWGADASGDGIVDGSDMALIDNASKPPPLFGYYPEDVNGDGVVDGSDMAIIDNNSKPPTVQIIKPF